MKKYYFSILLSIQTCIPSMDEYKFAESDRTIDVILINLSLLRDNMLLVSIAIGVFLGLLIYSMVKYVPRSTLLGNRTAGIVTIGIWEVTIRKLKRVLEKAKTKKFSIISVVFSLQGLHDFCTQCCRHLYKRNADVEIPTNRQLSCLGEDTLINQDELRFQDTDSKHFISLFVSDKILSDSLKNALSECFECSVLEDADRLLDVSAMSKPETIVIDETVKGISGAELCSRIKAEKATANIPVILLVDNENCESYIESGAHRVERKPVNIGLLKANIYLLIKSHLAMQEWARQFIKRSVISSFPLLKEDEDALEFISAVNKLLEEHLAEKTCTVKMLYLAMNMSRTSFYNKMINVTGHCPKRYMSLFKIEKAKQLLATRKHTMSEIAYMLGFCDSDYFRKQFKEICGVCPSEYNPDVIDKLVEQ